MRDAAVTGGSVIGGSSALVAGLTTDQIIAICSIMIGLVSVIIAGTHLFFNLKDRYSAWKAEKEKRGVNG